MILKRIVLKNFKGHDFLELEMNKLMYLTGKTGSGKTSAIEALQYLFTGKYNEYLKRNRENTSVIGYFEDGNVLERSYNGKNESLINGHKTTQKSVNQFLLDTYNINPEVFRFISIDLKNAKGSDVTDFILNEFLNIKFTKEKIIKYGKLTDDVINILNEEINDDSNLSIEELNDLHKEIYNKRRFLKKKISAESAIKEDRNNQIILKIENRSEKYLKNELIKYKNNKENILKQIGILNKAKEGKDKKENLIKRKLEIIEKIKSTGKPQFSNDVYQQLQLRKKAVENNINNTNVSLNILNNNLEYSKNILNKLAEPVCPISKKLVCKTDKTVIRSEVNSFINKQMDDISKLEAMKLGLIKENEELEYEIKKSEKEIEKMNNIKLLSQELNGINSLIEEIGDVDFVDEKINAFNNNLKKIEIVNKNIEALLEVIKKEELLSQMNKKISAYDSILKAIDNKSALRRKIVEMAITPVKDYINSTCKDINLNYKIDFSFSDEIKMKVEIDNEERELCDLSTGEKIIIVFLLSDMIAELSGIKIAFIDSLDSLDKESFESLLSLIGSEKIREKYDSIILASVPHMELLEVIAKKIQDVNVKFFSEKKGEKELNEIEQGEIYV